eukprot:GHRQ01007993.1.p1 GENE.GHRQ01007993.1~~GHRQ01007993.1.p1  ORF type:complete len:282 (+),score=110.28 GHRQ01007993.1:546-1391(+)
MQANICKRQTGASVTSRIQAFKPAGPVAWRRPAAARQQQHVQPCRAASDQQTASTPATSAAAQEYVQDNEFSITKISYGSILTPVGLVLMIYGFGAYFTLLPGTDISSILLIYGFPMSILGFALSYAQLEPVPCKTTRAAFDLRSSQMTDIQKQIREDTTRYRYGDEKHLDEALDKIWKFGRQGNPPKKMCPTLTGLREETVDGAYCLTLEFASKLELPVWEDRQPKFQSFFGPGVVAKVLPTEQGVDVQLVSDGSGAGRGGGEKKDVLPPLMPGLKARQQ